MLTEAASEARECTDMRSIGRAALIYALSAFIISGCGGAGVSELRLQGIDSLERGKYQEAVELLDSAMQKSKGRISREQFDILMYRAEAEYMLGDYEGAEKTLDILIKSDTERDEYLKLRERIKAKLLVRDASLALNEGRAEDARRLMDEAIASGMKNDRDLAFNEVVYLELTAQWDKAYESMLEFQSSYPGDSATERELEFLKTRAEALGDNPGLYELSGQLNAVTN